ncbi:MAG: 4-hydroxy-tetrahydrodipicolinate synthase [Alphaproteobacteria bacterium]
MFHGSIVALITPFLNGKIDLDALEKLVNWQIAEGTQGILACGATGEGSLLTLSEWQSVLRQVVTVAAGRVPVLAGCGMTGTAETIMLAQYAKELGAKAALIMTPCDVKPSQQGVYEHFRKISDTVHIPIIVYNNPGRAVVDLSVELIGRLAQLPRIVGLKDSHVDTSRVIALRRLVPQDFALLAGDDLFASAFLANGGHGCISITANVAPLLFKEFVATWFVRDIDRFMQLRDQLDPLYRALTAETNPVPIKFAMSHLGACHNELRLPLLPASAQTQDLIKEALGNL